MLADEIKTGESANTEFKVEVPKKSEKYIKSVVAFANTAGGKIILGVDDKTHEIVGVEKTKSLRLWMVLQILSLICVIRRFFRILVWIQLTGNV